MDRRNRRERGCPDGAGRLGDIARRARPEESPHPLRLGRGRRVPRDAEPTQTTPVVEAPAPAPPVRVATAAPAPPRQAPKEFESNSALTRIHFDLDKAEIRPGDARILDVNANWLREHPDQLVLIEGHCDERGTAEYNMVLGDRRAKSAMNYLASRGVPTSRISIISYGEERPLCTEKNEACWSENRRAMFLTKER